MEAIGWLNDSLPAGNATGIIVFDTAFEMEQLMPHGTSRLGTTGGATLGSCQPRAKLTGKVFWLQIVTIAWMSIEVGVSVSAAFKAKSPALLAFASDSAVELLSAVLVILAVLPSLRLKESQVSRWAGVLLFVLAGIVTLTAIFSLVRHVATESSFLGILVTAAALIVMPALAWSKRRAALESGNSALAADAVQSATCAYLAALTLLGLGINAAFHIRWVDPVAAISIVPFLVIEGGRAFRGEPCASCSSKRRSS